MLLRHFYFTLHPKADKLVFYIYKRNNEIQYDGTGDFLDISILDCKENSYLQFEWGEGSELGRRGFRFIAAVKSKSSFFHTMPFDSDLSF